MSIRIALLLTGTLIATSSCAVWAALQPLDPAQAPVAAVDRFRSVNDAATSVLMERFYFHLWQKKRSRIESLRQAQIDVLKNPSWVEDREKKLAAAKLLVRGFGKASAPLPKTGERRSPAAWWAAWQLSGDWR